MSNWPEAIKEELSYINEQALFADGFDEALVGIDMSSYVAVYDIEKCIDVLMQDTGMTLEESKEYFEYNTLGAYVGEYTPRFVRVYNGL
ncbi:hypothetical protein OAE97_01620 [Verrucomicrobia bacterium]|nr:hypothetical protein [Verrucomicrobiota bacterium]